MKRNRPMNIFFNKPEVKKINCTFGKVRDILQGFRECRKNEKENGSRTKKVVSSFTLAMKLY